MSVDRFRLLNDLKLQLRKEFSEITATSATNVFPESSESFNGLDPQHQFMILAYMEARFHLLEALSLMSTLVKRRLRLEDVDFILENGSLPIARKPPDVRSGTVISGLAGILNRIRPLVKNIINDHPRRLNLYAYRLTQVAFKGRIRERMIRMERAVFGLILGRHFKKEASHKCPRIVQWLAITSKDILESHLGQLSICDQLRLKYIIDLSERWSRIFGVRAENFKVHFSVFPQSLREDSVGSTLRKGMISLGAADVAKVCEELFEQLLLLMSRLIRPAPEQRSELLEVSLRHAQGRVKKFIESSEQRFNIDSVVQLWKDLPLLPPCIYALIARLKRDKRLPNNDRYRLLIFLKNARLPILEVEKFFRNIYNTNVDTSSQWTTIRAGHLRRVYRNEKSSQLRCAKFDRYCVWQRGSDYDTRKVLVKIRKGQQDNRETGLWCSGEDFQNLLKSPGSVSNADSARSLCATLGCFQGSEVPFYSPLGYYFNTKALSIRSSKADYRSDSSSEDSLSW
ncbi:uncharacterized protein LOC100905914 [Galendromus occidentalis]|uniref:Uncharacterized protein LOC100905914 n=1 Tax=Galendromus occidentalis TaxID=34638 RepID=A0AAJ7SE09_9ACAR|nr:uncharacterized protein LOC100905914 [Galendromus occidentalis]